MGNLSNRESLQWGIGKNANVITSNIHSFSGFKIPYVYIDISVLSLRRPIDTRAWYVHGLSPTSIQPI